MGRFLHHKYKFHDNEHYILTKIPKSLLPNRYSCCKLVSNPILEGIVPTVKLIKKQFINTKLYTCNSKGAQVYAHYIHSAAC